MINQILPGFAAIDIGAEHFFVAAAGAPEAVRRFGTFTSEIALLSAYLQEHLSHPCGHGSHRRVLDSPARPTRA